jgi:hypothetical protein
MTAKKLLYPDGAPQFFQNPLNLFCIMDHIKQQKYNFPFYDTLTILGSFVWGFCIDL